MNKSTLSQGEPWMTPEEHQLNQEFVHATTALLATRGVPETPLILIRINDVIATWLLARRLESALTPEPGEPAPCPTPAQAGAIGKCRDCLRRAMKELEACGPQDAASADLGLFDRLLQITQPIAGTNPANETPSPTQALKAGREDPKPSQDSSPARNNDTRPTNAAQPETCATVSTPAQPETIPTHPPPAAQPTRQRNPSKKRRKKRGCPKRARAS